MKLFNYDNVLCLSPHPDDVEFSMSGLIKKYSSTTFFIVVLSNGTSSDTTSGLNRINEINKFWELMSVKNIKLIPLSKNFNNIKEDEWINMIENKLSFPKLDAIFGTSSEDSHYEHHITNRILNALGRNKQLSIIEYKSPSTKEEWVPNFFVDIEHEYDIKINSLLKSFQSQSDSPYFKKNSIALFNSNYIISKLGRSEIESFKIIRKILI
jgi:LmbE family N-acetylglucosaminyl deacetylase